jgi:hypothetical protein
MRAGIMSRVPRPLPDTEAWQPRKPANASTVSSALAERCETLEHRISVALESARNLSFDAFDSGATAEGLVRDAFTEVLPSRYQTISGSVVDSDGMTAGDVDVVVFNAQWFPQVHAAAVAGGRRKLLPVEGVYAVGEVKQTLDERTLDEAMEKLVMCHRLLRMDTPGNRLTENRQGMPEMPGPSNPLYSFVVGAASSSDLQALVERFFSINKSLRRREVVRGLCVLGAGTVVWATRTANENSPAMFTANDLRLPIVPAYLPAPTHGPALFTLVENLLLHLYHSVLGPEDIASQYGPLDRRVKVPSTPDIHLDADPERTL